jgi:hypothetical protein
MGYTIREGFTNQDAWVVSVADALGNNSALLTATASDLILGAGLGLLFPSGTNGICGTATLAAGTVTISTNQVTANSVILITRRSRRWYRRHALCRIGYQRRRVLYHYRLYFWYYRC